MGRLTALRAALAALLLVAACLPRGSARLPVAAHTISEALLLTARQWQASPWARPSDMLVPSDYIYVLVDTNGSACLVPPSVWAQAPREWACETAWRLPRP